MAEKIVVARKKWYMSKTIWINILAVLGGVATAISGELATGGTITGIGIINLVMRVITSTKLE